MSQCTCRMFWKYRYGDDAPPYVHPPSCPASPDFQPKPKEEPMDAFAGPSPDNDSPPMKSHAEFMEVVRANETLLNENERLEGQIADMVKINDNLLSENKALEEENKALAKINDSLTEQNKKLVFDVEHARRMSDGDRSLTAKVIKEQATLTQALEEQRTKASAALLQRDAAKDELEAMRAERNHLMQILDEERAGHAATKEEAKKKDDLIIAGLKKEHDRLAVTQEHLMRLENRVAEVQRVVSKPIRIVKGKNAERLWGCKRCGCVFKSQKKANRCECA